MKTLEDIKREYNDLMKEIEINRQNPLYIQKREENWTEYNSRENRIAEAMDFFTNKGYLCLLPFEFKKYADIEKSVLSDYGLWSNDLQEKYDFILCESERLSKKAE